MVGVVALLISASYLSLVSHQAGIFIYIFLMILARSAHD